MTAITLQYLAEDRREYSIGKYENLHMDYFEFFFIFTHTARQKREPTWSKDGVGLWKKSKHKPKKKKSEDLVSLFIWKAELWTYSQVSYRNYNVSSIPLGEDDFIRQPTKKKAIVLQFLKIKETQKYNKYLYNSYIATDVGGLV